ncbi:alpha/beta hydrolase [Mycobacterium sp.]|uniref:alpha/beta fold hydrolase n=1 Tax=Mycobacterium sp. TaxID=1785 RepID=UPI002580894A|nr:alpha/beta hydrolase [Mycobacterium sp.]
MASRVAAVAVLGGTVPSVGPGAVAGTVADVARRFAVLVSELRRPLALMATGLLSPLVPFGHNAMQAYSKMSPPGNRVAVSNTEIEGMFIDDILQRMRGGFQAFIDDARMFGHDWGFQLADVKLPVRWWHGDADAIVSLPAAEDARPPDTELLLLPGKSHLEAFTQVDEVLEAIRQLL